MPLFYHLLESISPYFEFVSFSFLLFTFFCERQHTLLFGGLEMTDIHHHIWIISTFQYFFSSTKVMFLTGKFTLFTLIPQPITCPTLNVSLRIRILQQFPSQQRVLASIQILLPITHSVSCIISHLDSTGLFIVSSHRFSIENQNLYLKNGNYIMKFWCLKHFYALLL